MGWDVLLVRSVPFRVRVGSCSIKVGGVLRCAGVGVLIVNDLTIHRPLVPVCPHPSPLPPSGRGDGCCGRGVLR